MFISSNTIHEPTEHKLFLNTMKSYNNVSTKLAKGERPPLATAFISED